MGAGPGGSRGRLGQAAPHRRRQRARAGHRCRAAQGRDWPSTAPSPCPCAWPWRTSPGSPARPNSAPASTRPCCASPNSALPALRTRLADLVPAPPAPAELPREQLQLAVGAVARGHAVSARRRAASGAIRRHLPACGGRAQRLVDRAARPGLLADGKAAAHSTGRQRPPACARRARAALRRRLQGLRLEGHPASRAPHRTARQHRRAQHRRRRTTRKSGVA